MSRFKPGQDILVDFDGSGTQWRGEVITQARGWVMAVIEIDLTADWGSISARLAPYSTVCVPESRVKPAGN